MSKYKRRMSVRLLASVDGVRPSVSNLPSINASIGFSDPRCILDDWRINSFGNTIHPMFFPFGTFSNPLDECVNLFLCWPPIGDLRRHPLINIGVCYPRDQFAVFRFPWDNNWITAWGGEDPSFVSSRSSACRTAGSGP